MNGYAGNTGSGHEFISPIITIPAKLCYCCKMPAALTIIRYRKRYIPIAILAMAVHHIPLWLNKKTTFYKLLGCGRNGTFDKHPEWQQWGILVVQKDATSFTGSSLKDVYGNFIAGWFRFFNCETCTFFLEPVAGHGSWDGKECFGALPAKNVLEGMVAVLTRATIRFSQLSSFWENVDPVAAQMSKATGLITSLGIGEIPYIKQATFSVWQSQEHMKNFAYVMKEHAAVVRKTRKEKWYSEEMFVRFKILKITGTIRGKSPLE